MARLPVGVKDMSESIGKPIYEQRHKEIKIMVLIYGRKIEVKG